MHLCLKVTCPRRSVVVPSAWGSLPSAIRGALVKEHARLRTLMGLLVTRATSVSPMAIGNALARARQLLFKEGGLCRHCDASRLCGYEVAHSRTL